MSDIVERLEGWALDLAVGRNCHGADQDIRKAADEIVRLRAERDEQRSLANGRMAALIAAEEERAAAEAERDRLRDEVRKAVKVVRDLLDWADDYQRWGMSPTHDALSPARAFLAALKGDTP